MVLTLRGKMMVDTSLLGVVQLETVDSFTHPVGGIDDARCVVRCMLKWGNPLSLVVEMTVLCNHDSSLHSLIRQAIS